MTNNDRAAKEATSLWLKTKVSLDGNWQLDMDNQNKIVEAVAAKLRALYGEIERLQNRKQAYEFIQRAFDELEKSLGEALMEVHDLRAKLAGKDKA